MVRISRKYVAQRALLCALAIIFMLLATNPVVRVVVVSAVQRVTGARVDLAQVRSSMRDTHVQLVDLEVADPYHPMKNLFQADIVDLDLDPGKLLRRQAVIRRGRIRGLKLGTDRDRSGELDSRTADRYESEQSKYFERLGRDWLLSATEHLQAGLDSNIESVRVAGDLLSRWPDEYAKIEAKAILLRERVVVLRDSLSSAGENPLRNRESYQQAINDLNGLGREIFEVRRQVDQIRQQMKMDQVAINEVRAKDLQLLSADMDLGSLDPAALSEYLLGPDVTEHVENVLQWVRWSRKFSPTLTARRTTAPGRGREIFFPGTEPRANVVIDSMVLQGEGEFGNSVVNLEGTIHGLTTHPRRTGKATEVVIQTTGARPILIQATFDGSKEQARDTVLIDVPGVYQKPRLLGNTEQLAVAVSPCVSHSWLKLAIEGDQLSGELLIKQSEIAMTPQLNPSFETEEINTAIAKSLSDIETLDVAVDLSGTLTSPAWQMRSNLGAHMANRLRDAVHEHLANRNEENLRAAHEQIDAKVRSMETELLAKQQLILESLQFDTNEIEKVRNDIATRVESTDGVIDPKSPLRETFKR